MFRCSVKGEYCEKMWLGCDGLCDCLVDFDNPKCEEEKEKGNENNQ